MQIKPLASNHIELSQDNKIYDIIITDGYMRIKATHTKSGVSKTIFKEDGEYIKVLEEKHFLDKMYQHLEGIIPTPDSRIQFEKIFIRINDRIEELGCR